MQLTIYDPLWIQIDLARSDERNEMNEVDLQKKLEPFAALLGDWSI